jgi:preprotein translocase subunit SecG
MDFLLKLLTVVLALDCLFLILLILVQLPKKEAGAGTAFGGGTTDALFGAGTGNALTKLTTYATAVFFVLSLVLSIANASKSNMERKGRFDKVIQPAAASQSTQQGVPTSVKTSPTNMLSMTATNALAATNAAASTNKPVASALIEAAKTATNAAVKAVLDAAGTNQPAKAK